jgi:hypothetical protein
MKNFIALFTLMLASAGCHGMNEIDFVYFNLSPNEIVVDSITGLPLWASPGVLVPVHAEDRLSEKSATSFDEPVDVSAMLKIVWQENGQTHQAELKRNDLGIPAKLKSGKVRFTYLGADKWRVKVLK